MKKATHSGTCQVCGRGQKLPDGKLSKHGYTKQWGFFSGTCWGADHLPFEQDISLIETAIKRATEHAVQLEAESAELKAGKQLPEGKAWYRVYDPAIRGPFSNGYVWREVVIRGTKHEPKGGWEHWTFTYQDGARPEERLETYSADFGTKEGESKVDAVRRWSNVKYAEQELDKHAEQLRSYVTWQQERIKNWKPTPLTPVGQEAATLIAEKRKGERAAKAAHNLAIHQSKRAYEKELTTKNNIMLELPRGERDSKAWQELYYYSPATKYAAGLRAKLDAVRAEDQPLAIRLLPHINAAIALAAHVEELKAKK